MNDNQAIFEAYEEFKGFGRSKEPHVETDENGTINYMQGPYLHREDGPAIEYTDGKHSFWLDGQFYTAKNWAREMLNRQGKPRDNESVDEFLRPILAKQAQNFI